MVVSTVVLQQTMESYIPFKTPNHIMNIPPMQVTTESVICMMTCCVGVFKIPYIDSSYTGLGERITGVASAHATVMC
jgi:hypothetical protein